MLQPVRSSSFTPCWATLPKPDQLSLVRRDGSDPAYPGGYKLAVSLVDDQGQIGPMGPVASVSPTMPNWSLRIRLRGVPLLTKACAWVLWCKRDDGTTSDDFPQYEWRPYNGRHIDQVRPYLPLCGWDSHATRSLNIKRSERRDPGYRWEPYEDDAFWPKNIHFDVPSEAPEVEILHVPNVQTGVAFAWVGNDGESLPSDVLLVDALAWGSDNSAPIMVARSPYLPPNGALGMHVYLVIDGTWHRQPAPHIADLGLDYEPNDWLWPLTMQQFYIERVVESDIGPATAAGRSWLSSRNRAVYETQASVIIDTDDKITCPIISPHKDLDAKFYDVRTIAGELQQQVWYETSTVADGITGYATDWPFWIETAQRTRLVGAKFKSDTSVGGIDFLSYIGSSSFHMRPERLFVELGKNGYCFGARVLAEAHGLDGHSASEPIFSDAELTARFGFIVEYGQSANWQCHNTTVNCTGNDLASTPFTINNSGNFKATGRTTTDGGRALLAVMSAKQVKLEEWFSDQGHPTWVVIAGYGGGAKVEIECAATNHQGVQKSFLHLAEVPACGNDQNTLIITGNSGSVGWTPVAPPAHGWWLTSTDVAVSIFCPRYSGIRYSIDKMHLLRLFSPPAPNWAQWQQVSFIQSSSAQAKYVDVWDNGIDVATIVHSVESLGVALR